MKIAFWNRYWKFSWFDANGLNCINARKNLFFWLLKIWILPIICEINQQIIFVRFFLTNVFEFVLWHVCFVRSVCRLQVFNTEKKATDTENLITEGSRSENEKKHIRKSALCWYSTRSYPMWLLHTRYHRECTEHTPRSGDK